LSFFPAAYSKDHFLNPRHTPRTSLVRLFSKGWLLTFLPELPACGSSVGFSSKFVSPRRRTSRIFFSFRRFLTPNTRITMEGSCLFREISCRSSQFESAVPFSFQTLCHLFKTSSFSLSFGFQWNLPARSYSPSRYSVERPLPSATPPFFPLFRGKSILPPFCIFSRRKCVPQILFLVGWISQ